MSGKIARVVLRRELGRVHDVAWKSMMHGPIDVAVIAGGAGESWTTRM